MSPDSSSDAAWVVQRACAGDAAALAAFVQRERGLLLAHIRGRLGRRLREIVEAEDVLQDVAISAIQALPRFRAESRAQLRAWLNTLIRHRIISLARQARARDRSRSRAALPAERVDALGECSGDEIALADEPSGSLSERREDARRALARLDGLSADERLAVVARDLLGLPLDTTAFLLCRTLSAASKLHQRARARLMKNC